MFQLQKLSSKPAKELLITPNNIGEKTGGLNGISDPATAEKRVTKEKTKITEKLRDNEQDKQVVRPWLSVPENLSTFKVLSYNVLADCLANLKKDDDPYMQFNVRFTKIKAEIVDSAADVVAL